MSAILNARESAVRAAMVAWDPLGVFAPLRSGDDPNLEWSRDEYDDLVLPLLGRLQRGESAAEIAAYLEAELSDRYGLGPGFGDRATGLIDALQRWWVVESKRQT